MNSALIALALSFSIAYFFIPVIIRIAKAKRLFDEPDERKIHSRPISSLGGVGIFAGFVFSLLLTVSFTSAAPIQHYVTAGLVIFFLGLKDDIMVIKPLKKLMGQVIAAGILVHLGNLQIHSMFGFLGVEGIPEPLGILFSYFLIILIINACNLIDGIDGLAGLLGASITLFLGAYFLFSGYYTDAAVAFALAGALIAFLLYNMQPARIFMGDGGSMLIGLVVAVLIIRFINIAPANSAIPIIPAPAVAFGILVIPLMDTLRVFTIRMLQGHSPFRPDKNHVHHLLLRRNWSHRKIAFVLTGANIGFGLLSFAGADLNVNLLFLIIGGLFIFTMGLIARTPDFGKKESLILDKKEPAPVKQRATVNPPQSIVAKTN